MIIEEISEENYKEAIEEGQKELDEKFRKFDELINSEADHGEEVGYLLRTDGTLWAYAFLKDPQGNPLKLRPFQDKIINDKHRFIQVVASNQIGKTLTAQVKALHHALHVDNASVCIASSSEDQAVRVLDEIKALMRRSNIEFASVLDEVDNRTEIHIKNSDGRGFSRIKCFPATRAILGYYATLLVLDELAFWEKGMELYYQIFEPRTNETKNWKHPHFTMGQIFMISNPCGQQGIYWYIWSQDERFHRYRYCWLANPSNTITEYLDAKKRSASDTFDSVYAAVFSSETGGFITKGEYDNAVLQWKPISWESMILFLGGDFAGEDTTSRDTDHTVLFGCVADDSNPTKFMVVYSNEFPQKTKKEIVYEEIKRLRETYSVSGIAYDKVGVGESVMRDLIERNIFSEYQIVALTYSLPNKSEVYYNLKHLFEQGRVILKDNPRLKEQLMGLRFVRKPGSTHMQKPLITVHHATESIKDDMADALANCLYLAVQNSVGKPGLLIANEASLKSENTGRKGTLRVCIPCDRYHFENEECLSVL